MREILFRGKSRDTNKWVFGDFVSDACGISHEEYLNEYGDIGHIMTYIIPETAGQYTGLTDKNDKRIFEDDIVKLYLIDGVEEGVIKFNDIMCRFMFFTKEGSYSFDKDCIFEIIGNIHDNPELLNL